MTFTYFRPGDKADKTYAFIQQGCGPCDPTAKTDGKCEDCDTAECNIEKSSEDSKESDSKDSDSKDSDKDSGNSSTAQLSAFFLPLIANFFFLY